VPAAIPLAKRGTRLKAGAVLVSSGCAGGAWQTAWKGHVLNYEGNNLNFQPPPANGRSGSAVIDPTGPTIVGVLRARTVDQRPHGIATATDSLYSAFVDGVDNHVIALRKEIPCQGLHASGWEPAAPASSPICGPFGCTPPQYAPYQQRPTQPQPQPRQQAPTQPAPQYNPNIPFPKFGAEAKPQDAMPVPNTGPSLAPANEYAALKDEVQALKTDLLTLQKLLREGKLKGEKGDKGDAGSAADPLVFDTWRQQADKLLDKAITDATKAVELSQSSSGVSKEAAKTANESAQAAVRALGRVDAKLSTVDSTLNSVTKETTTVAKQTAVEVVNTSIPSVVSTLGNVGLLGALGLSGPAGIAVMLATRFGWRLLTRRRGQAVRETNVSVSATASAPASAPADAPIRYRDSAAGGGYGGLDDEIRNVLQKLQQDNLTLQRQIEGCNKKITSISTNPIIVKQESVMPQEVVREKVYTEYAVPTKRQTSLEMAMDQLVRENPGARGAVDVIESYAKQIESGLRKP
jgi:hypothetical protein